MLCERGVFESQCDEIMARVKADPINEPLQDYWHINPDEMDWGSPFNLIWYNVCSKVLEYIDETRPSLWCRPVFAAELSRLAGRK